MPRTAPRIPGCSVEVVPCHDGHKDDDNDECREQHHCPQEHDQPGMSAVSGDPNRTSFELQLNLEQAHWLAATVLAEGQRTLDGRSADALRTEADGHRLGVVAVVHCCGASGPPHFAAPRG